MVILIGCGAKAGEFKQTAGEMKEGPAVLTGEEGALVVYDSKQGEAFPQFKGNKSEEGSKEASEKAGEAAPAASDTPAESTQPENFVIIFLFSDLTLGICLPND